MGTCIECDVSAHIDYHTDRLATDPGVHNVQRANQAGHRSRSIANNHRIPAPIWLQQVANSQRGGMHAGDIPTCFQVHPVLAPLIL